MSDHQPQPATAARDDDDAARIGEITERERAATPGPWIGEIRSTYTIPPRACADLWSLVERNTIYPGLPRMLWGQHAQPSAADLDFVANARADIPYLLERIGEQDDELARLRTSRDAFRNLSGRHLDRLRNLEEVDREHAHCSGHLAVLNAALAAAEGRETAWHRACLLPGGKSCRICFGTWTGDPDWEELPAGHHAWCPVGHILAAPPSEGAGSEGASRE